MATELTSTYRRIKVDPTDWFEAKEVEKAKTYQRPLTIIRVVSGALSLALLLVILSTHAAVWLADKLARDSWELRLIYVTIGITLVFSILELPFSIWTTFSHEKKWGFSTQTPKGYVVDQLKGFVLGLAIELPLLLALWWVIRSTDLWWLAGWGVFFVFTVLLGFLLPIVIMPIFNKFTPLSDAKLARRLNSLAEGAGMKVQCVQVMDASKRTRKDNAFFAGLGRTRRIVVFDNLLEHSPAIVASVVAHELGHWRRRHVPKSIVQGAVASLGLFVGLRFVALWRTALDWAGVDSIRDPASLPLVALVFIGGSMVTGLVGAWFSRAHERQADIDALEITQDFKAFVDTERNLSTKNLIDLAPSWWHYLRASHPPPAERLQLGELWRRQQKPKSTPRKSKPAAKKAAPKRKPAAKAKPARKAKPTRESRTVRKR